MKALILLTAIFILVNQSAHAQMEVSPDQIWADKQCGGNAAYKTDEKKFNACVAENLNSKGSGKYKPGACISNLVDVLGSNYKFISKDMITHLEKDGTLTVLYANGRTTKVQPNGDCFKDPNKMNDFSTAMTAAYQKAKDVTAHADKKSEETGDPVFLQGHPQAAIDSCDEQEKNSEWYKIATELLPKLQGPAQKTGTAR